VSIIIDVDVVRQRETALMAMPNAEA